MPGKTSSCLPEAERAVANGDLGCDGEATRFEVDQELAPALRALPDPDMEAEQFFLPLGRGADDDEDALRLGLHTGLKIDAVGPNVDVAAGREIAALPALVFLLPPGREPRDHAWRQVRGVGTEDGGKRLLEVAGGDAAQVENRQQCVEAPGTPGPSRQDVRREPDLLAAFSLRGAVPDLRSSDFERADPGLDHALGPYPCRTTRWRPSGSRSSQNCSTKASTSACRAAASMRRAPSRASP